MLTLFLFACGDKDTDKAIDTADTSDSTVDSLDSSDTVDSVDTVDTTDSEIDQLLYIGAVNEFSPDSRNLMCTGWEREFCAVGGMVLTEVDY
jgi:hypothetical protein